MTTKQTEALKLIAAAGGKLYHRGHGIKKVLINGHVVNGLAKLGYVRESYEGVGVFDKWGQEMVKWFVFLTDEGRKAVEVA